MQKLHPGLLCAVGTALGPVRVSESAGLRRLGPSARSTRPCRLGPCQALSVEFASENSWFLLTGEGRTVTAFVPGLRVSDHTAEVFMGSSRVTRSVILSHSRPPGPFLALAHLTVKRPCVHAFHLHKWHLQMTSTLTLLVTNKEPTHLQFVATLCCELRRGKRRR